MEINVNEARKIVEIWLTNVEKNDEALKEQLKSIYEKYHAKKYLVAVFQSGTQDLYQATSDLLCYNRKRTAQFETEQEEQQGMTLSM